jgi:hypothetical protein
MAKVGRIRVVLSKWVSVGCERQVSWLTDRLSSNKWPTDHLECEVEGDGDRGIQIGDATFTDWGKSHGEGACHERMRGKDYQTLKGRDSFRKGG